MMTKVCAVCGKEYETKWSTQKYCCPACKRKADRQQWRAYYDRRLKGTGYKSKKKLSDTLIELKDTGESYAEHQKKDTIEKYARVIVE